MMAPAPSWGLFLPGCRTVATAACYDRIMGHPLEEPQVLIVEEKPTIAKAVVAASGALGVAIVSALADGKVTVWELVLGVLATIGTTAAVWAVSNKP